MYGIGLISYDQNRGRTFFKHGLCILTLPVINHPDKDNLFSTSIVVILNHRRMENN